MDILEQKARHILDSGYLLSLAVHDRFGLWVSDLTFAHENFILYWRSRVDTRHSRAILDAPNVAGSITVNSGPNEKDLGVQFIGTAKSISHISDAVLQLYTKKNQQQEVNPTSDPKMHTWYSLTIFQIDIIDEAAFGYSKQTIKIDRSHE